MKNNLLGKIAMQIKNIGKSKLDFTHDCSTTAGFGDIQPTTCKLILPDSNGRIDSKNLVRFGTMVAPTFGRIKAKEYHHLVPMSDLLENFAFMLAQGKRKTGYNQSTIAPEYVPNMALGLLSRFCLVGAEIEFYPNLTTDDGTTLSIKENNTEALCLDVKNGFTDLADYVKENVTGTGLWAGYKGSCLNLGKITKPWAEANNLWSVGNHDFWIPIKNRDIDSCFGIRKKDTIDSNGQPTQTKEIKHLPIDSSSLCLVIRVANDEEYTLVIRLSSFGKRIRKQIIGAGKQINLCSTAPVEIVSLMAIWKAYFDLFGLTLYENYELTPLYEFGCWCDLFNRTNLNAYWANDEVWKFMLELGRMWYTDAQDLVSAHVSSTAISPSLGLGQQFIDVAGTGANITEIDNPNGTNTNGHALINAIQHGHLDAEYLERLYRWCNKNTVVGKEIAKVLRAQNLGKFVDSCKSNFIGYHEEMMTIYDVVSTADTFKDGEGSMLGEYGGRGLKVYESGSKSFSTDEFAFQVSLFTIVPEAGYLQAIDPASYSLKKTDYMLGEFEALGYEASRKTVVCGAENWSSQCDSGNFGSMDETFGFLPRGSHLKFAHNISNGDLTLRDTRAAYLPYTLDKFIDVGERRKTAEYGTAAYRRMNYIRELTPSTIPHASLHYRYPCKYPWMGDFTRIFAYQGEPLDDDFFINLLTDSDSEAKRWEFLENSYDNFIVHMLIQEPVWSPCKAIEESFETYPDDEKPNAKVDKA